MFETLLFGIYAKHRYTLASTGLKIREHEFTTRQQAEHEMHKIMKKHALHIVEVYDDKHYKTYLCNDNVRFYINRV